MKSACFALLMLLPTVSADASDWILDKDGVLLKGEYEVIDRSGATTRALCPYTCEDRQLPKAHCRAWTSAREPEKCYVADTRLPSSAIQFGDEKASPAGERSSVRTKNSVATPS